MSSLVVRPFRASDHERAIALWQEGFAELGPDMLRRMRSPIYLGSAALLSLVALGAGYRVASMTLMAGVAFVMSPLADAALPAALWRGILEQTRENMTPLDNFARHWLVPGKSAFFVAELDGTIVGCAGVIAKHALFKEAKRLQHIRAADVEDGPSVEASVWRVGVDRNVRRVGIGKALMGAVEAWAVDAGCERVSLVTGNSASKRFYTAIGYESETIARASAILFRDTRSSLLLAIRRYVLSERIRSGNILVKTVASCK